MSPCEEPVAQLGTRSFVKVAQNADGGCRRRRQSLRGSGVVRICSIGGTKSLDVVQKFVRRIQTQVLIRSEEEKTVIDASTFELRQPRLRGGGEFQWRNACDVRPAANQAGQMHQIQVIAVKRLQERRRGFDGKLRR